MSIRKLLRFEVFKRDGFTCQYCGRKPPTVVLHIDHIHPRVDGGGDEETNLITACVDCNLGKGARRLEDVPQPVADRFERQREARDQLEAYNAFLLEQRERDVERVDALGRYFYNQNLPDPEFKDRYTWSDDRARSVKRFLTFLPAAEIYEAIDIAFTRRPPTRSTGYDKHTFLYFCGVCWSKIREARGEGGAA